MRFHVGPVPDDPDFRPDGPDWRKIREPSFGVLMLLALPTSVLLAAGMLAAWAAVAGVSSESSQVVIGLGTMVFLVAAIVALVAVHELTHAFALPKCGLTSATVAGFWPQKLTPYVSHEGELSRGRYIAVGLSPFVLLSLVPLFVGALFAWAPTWLVALSTLNAFAASGDLIGGALLAYQTPRGAVVRSKGLETWWRASDPRVRPRALRWVFGSVCAALIIGLTVLAAIPPAIISGMVDDHVAFAEVWTGEEYDLSPVRLALTTSDGLEVTAYEVRAEDPKAVVVFLSGIHNPSVTAFFGHARMLLDEGYSSILLEMRAHGESEGDVIALGYEEHRDVRAVVEHVMADPAYGDVPVVVFGVSMGAATAINSVGQMPEIDGLISLSAYSSWDDVFVDNMGIPEPLATAQRAFVRLYTGVKYGFGSGHIVPKRQIGELGDRPALIAHSTGDSQIPFASFGRLVERAPSHVELWAREGDKHFIVDDDSFLEPWNDPEYAGRIIGFLERNFVR